MTTEPVTFLGRVQRDRASGVVTPVGEAARRMSSYREIASADFALMDQMRDRARAVRLHTLANLDRYLAQFAGQVEANGGYEALKAMKKTLWEGTGDWNILLEKKAEISGELVLSEFTKSALEKFKK